MTTIGQLIADLYTKYERRYHDGRLAAVATQIAIEDLLQRRATSKRHAA